LITDPGGAVAVIVMPV